ncbi:MAG: ATP-binding protein, partial [Intestinibacter sp.]|uniref:AAA family ATPase n=1 Tax=Intestinibacter sp. TaxID=1965304 RepID=UPI0025C37D9F
NIEEIERVFLFFAGDIVIYNSNINNWKDYSIKLMQESEELKKVFLIILQHLGTGIKDIKVKYEENIVNIESFPIDIPAGLKSLLKDKKTISSEAKIVYDDFETDLDMEESTGIKKLFEIICPIIDVLKHGKIMIFDEIEVGLHESVAYSIIELFNYFKSDEFAQLFFTTHDTSLLDSNIFRRDQIWFTELDEERSTDLYSLLEIKNVRKGENLAKGYVIGRYGAIPMLNKNFSEIFEEISSNNGGM